MTFVNLRMIKESFHVFRMKDQLLIQLTKFNLKELTNDSTSKK